EALERFLREARAASALNHPHICTVHEVDACEGQHFIAMELIHGQNLNERISGMPLEPGELLELAIQIADALDPAHSKGIIHRDVKPANMFIADRNQVKVLDFGLAKVIPELGASREESAPTLMANEEHLTSPGMTMGTIAYMSPEQVRGEEVDARTDLFS